MELVSITALITSIFSFSMSVINHIRLSKCYIQSNDKIIQMEIENNNKKSSEKLIENKTVSV